MGYSVLPKYKGKFEIDNQFRLHFGGYRSTSIKEAKTITFPEGVFAVFETASGNFHRVHRDVMRRDLSFKVISDLVARFPGLASL